MGRAYFHGRTNIQKNAAAGQNKTPTLSNNLNPWSFQHFGNFSPKGIGLQVLNNNKHEAKVRSGIHHFHCFRL